jgi:hypothetical protein
MRLCCAIIALLVGCHHGESAPGASCAHVGDHLSPALERETGGLAAALRDTIVKHCTQDGWSGSARSCVSRAESRGEADQCDTRWLTHEQHTALAEALRAVVKAADAPAPAPPPPPAP